jgi:serine/threonine protein kinase
MSVRGKVKWAHDYPSKPGYYIFGVEFDHEPSSEVQPLPSTGIDRGRMSPSDLEFLLNTNLFNAIPRESVCPLLNSLTYKHCKPGERFITQGDEGDSFYIIRRGSCIVKLEKDDVLHEIARLKEGDIVGEMAILTGGRRSTHVDAETDLELWGITRSQFDSLSEGNPDLRIFLTEIITLRFSASKMTAFRTIGKYVISEFIGQGGWSIVYKGFHAKLNLPVAIKMLKHNMAMDPEFLEKFQNEAKTIARLNHTNIVNVYDIDELYRTVFIIMEYLEGVPLDYILEHMPKMPLVKILDIIMQVCSGLDYAHKQGIVHQDIKPANIFVQPDGHVKIVDFGLACPPGSIDFNLPGTVFYMSPEQIRSDPVDERTDIYSLGITAYEMVTGKRPFPEDDLARLMDMHLQEEVPDPRLLSPDLPDELSIFLTKSTQKDPDTRYQSVSQILNEILPFAEKYGLQTQLHKRKKEKMLGLFLFYNEEQQLVLSRLIDEFHSNISEAGAVLRVAQLENV